MDLCKLLSPKPYMLFCLVDVKEVKEFISLWMLHWLSRRNARVQRSRFIVTFAVCGDVGVAISKPKRVTSICAL